MDVPIVSDAELNQGLNARLTLDEARAEFVQALDQTIRQSLIGRWWGAMATISRWITRRQRPTPFWVVVFVSALLTLSLSFGAALVLGESAVLQFSSIWQLGMWVGYTALFSVVMQRQFDHSVAVLNTTVTEDIRSSHHVLPLQRFIQRLSHSAWQLPVTQ